MDRLIERQSFGEIDTEGQTERGTDRGTDRERD